MIEFLADHIQISGPKATDGSYKVTFETGEFQQENVVELMKIPQRVEMKIKVEYEVSSSG